MDENVVFDNKNGQSTDAAPPPDAPPADASATPDAAATADPAAAPAETEAVAADPAGEATDATDATETTTEETESEEEPPPPPTGIAALFASGKAKKILIGVVCFIILLILIMIMIPKKPAVKNVELVWWGLWEDARVMRPIIADFEKANPNIKVKYTKQDPKKYRERLVTRIQNGTGPDIFRFHNSWYPMLSEVLLPLSSDVITPEEFKKTFYPVMEDDLIQNGAIYGIPLGADTLALFVNTEMFEKAGVAPPTNWDEFNKAAKKLTIPEEDTGKIKIAGAALGTYNNISHAPDIISLIFLQQGVNVKKFGASPKDEMDALDFYTSFAKGQSDNVVWDSTLDNSMLAFSRGNLAMYFGYSWDVFRVQSLNPDLKFKVYPVPALVNKSQSIASYWVEGASSKSPNTKEALLFMQYLAKKETAQKFYTEVAKTRGFGEPYARADLADSLKDNPLAYPFVSQLKNASSTYFSGDTYDGEGGLNFLLNNYLGTAITTSSEGNTSTQSVIDTLDQGVAQTYEKFGLTQE